MDRHPCSKRWTDTPEVGPTPLLKKFEGHAIPPGKTRFFRLRRNLVSSEIRGTTIAPTSTDTLQPTPCRSSKVRPTPLLKSSTDTLSAPTPSAQKDRPTPCADTLDRHPPFDHIGCRWSSTDTPPSTIYQNFAIAGGDVAHAAVI